MASSASASILERLQGVFQTVFRDPGLAIADDLTAEGIPRWDSLSHIALVVAVEREFKIRFSTGEIHYPMSVGALRSRIERHLQAPEAR